MNFQFCRSVGVIAASKQAILHMQRELVVLLVHGVGAEIVHGFDNAGGAHAGRRLTFGCVTSAVDTHNLKGKIAMPVGHEQAVWSDSKLANLFAPGVLLVDRLEPPCSDDLLSH